MRVNKSKNGEYLENGNLKKFMVWFNKDPIFKSTPRSCGNPFRNNELLFENIGHSCKKNTTK